MHHIALLALMSVVMASHSAIIEAPDDACGYLNGTEQAPFGCHSPSEKCAIYYPTSSMAAPSTLLPMITSAPQPSVICYEPSQADCTVQPTTCVDSFGDCTGACLNDPLTLKCTADSHLYCNRAHFESPLSLRNIMTMDSGLRSTVAPVDGWFCGPPPSPVQQGDASHNQTASMTHIISSPVSVTTTLDVTITLSKPGPALDSSFRTSVSPTTTLSVTITLSRPGQTPGLSPSPSPPAGSAPEEIDYENGTHSGDSTTTETTTASPRRPPVPRKGKKNRLNVTGITCGAIFGFFIILCVYWVWRKAERRRSKLYCENIEALASIAGTQQVIEMLDVPQTAPDSRPSPLAQEAPARFSWVPQGHCDDVDDPAPRSVSSLDDIAPQSEGSLEQEAYENAMGVKGLEESNRAANVRRGQLVMF